MMAASPLLWAPAWVTKEGPHRIQVSCVDISRAHSHALVDKPKQFDELPVNLGLISLKELQEATRALKNGKACGPDQHPVEYWKAVLCSAAGGLGEASGWLLDFCNACWSQSDVPDSWHLQRVTLIYKKGDPADCGNYRPICLLNAAYKIFAMVLLRRLHAAGADAFLWPSQFGFRPERSTDDALHCARRAVELAWAHRGGSVHLLALDWKRAFDSINSESLLQALTRFGLPGHVVSVIRAIYSN